MGRVVANHRAHLALREAIVKELFGENAEPLVGVGSRGLAEISGQLKETSGKLDMLLTKVDSGPGSVAKLINDPGAYNDVRAVLQRMDSLLADIKKNPKRYINVKIF